MLHEIDAGDLIDFARRWADLGDAVEPLGGLDGDHALFGGFP